MEVTGKVIRILDAQSGASQRTGEIWVKNHFVIETGGQYPKKIALSVFGEDRWNKMGIEVGKTYNVHFDIDAREWKGRWFNDLSVWNAVCVDSNAGNGGQQQTQTRQESPVQNAQPATEDSGGGSELDVPF